MYELLLITSAITPVSVAAQFQLFLFIVSQTYLYLLILSSQQSVSAVSGPSIYHLSYCISYSFKLLLQHMRYHEVIVLSTRIKCPITYSSQVLLSLIQVVFAKLIVSATPSYSYHFLLSATRNRYSLLLLTVYQLLLTVSAIFINQSFQLLVSGTAIR